jgi:hypothetical protein
MILMTPWLVVIVYYGLRGIVQQAGISNPFSEPIPFDYLVKLLAVFNFTGQPGTLRATQITRSLTLTAVSMLALIMLRLAHSKSQKIIALLSIWLLPFSFVPFIWMLSPQSHPRYLMPYFLSAWLIVAVLARQSMLNKGLRLILLSSTLVTIIFGLETYLFNEAYFRTDIRSAAIYLKENARPGDVVFIPYTDWSLPQYDTGSANIYMIPEHVKEQEIASYISSHPGTENIYLLDYQRGMLDSSEYVHFMLSRQGYLAERIHFHNVYLDRYVRNTTYTPVDCRPFSQVCVEGDPLCLIGVDIPNEGVSGAMLPISLCWSNANINHRYVLAFRLYTESGILVSSADDLLQNIDSQPSELWEESAFSRTYHRLPLTMGLLPKPYILELSIYTEDNPDLSTSFLLQDGTILPSVVLGKVTPSISVWIDSSPETVIPNINTMTPLNIDGLVLQGSRIDPSSITPGSNLYITLLWHVASDVTHKLTPAIHILQNGVELTQVIPWNGFDNIPEGRMLLDHNILVIPADVAAGPLDLVLSTGLQRDDIALGSIYVQAVEHVYEVPQIQYATKSEVAGIATLLGFNIEPVIEISAGDTFTVTLVWQAGELAQGNDLKVFVQLIDEERSVVAQHDSIPVNWTRPTTGWIEGEIIIDSHPVHWLTDEPGSGDVYVGLYDSVTGTRVKWENGEDALKLPLQFDY